MRSCVSLSLSAPGFLFGFFLAFLELVDQTVDHLHLLLGGHIGKSEQRVLQVHVAGIHRELVEHIAAPLQQRYIGEIVGQQRHSLRVAWLSQIVAVLIEIYLTQCKLHQSFVESGAGRLGHTFLVCFDSRGCVAARHI